MPTQSEPVSPPPITRTFLFFANISMLELTFLPDTLSFCCDKNSVTTNSSQIVDSTSNTAGSGN